MEVVGLNCFNPKLGVVEVGDARQIMGIMVDTEYDTESFRARLINVRQVGRNQRTLRNLRAAFHREVDQEKWEQMLTTKTIPFELPERGVKIAVKVIDQTGMEHMTVIDDREGFYLRVMGSSGGERRKMRGTRTPNPMTRTPDARPDLLVTAPSWSLVPAFKCKQPHEWS